MIYFPNTAPVILPGGGPAPRNPNLPVRIGIIYNGCNAEDIASYNAQFRQINQMTAGRVILVFMGYKPDEDKDNILAGVTYECGPSISIVHYFKQLIENRIDLLFIPLINNKFNITSENINKYFEAALFKIPVMVINIFPYQMCVSNQITGFTYDKPEEFVPYLIYILNENITLLAHCGANAQADVLKKFDYNTDNLKMLEECMLGQVIG